MDGLTHLGNQGEAHMVEVGQKKITERMAVASARVKTRPEIVKLIADGKVPKGDVLAAARIAGIMAAKETSRLIPLCHPLALTSVSIDFTIEEASIAIRTTVRATDKTGVEMEALTAASVAALTLYDMCKSADREMVIESIRLEEKSGGKSGHFLRGKT